jgi:hypothetical protein
MSVGTRRLAAAQRTAASTPTSRRRRLAAWIVIVPALSFFSFTVVANAAGLGGKPSVAEAAAKVVPPAAPDKQDRGGDGVIVVVNSPGDDNPVRDALGSHGKEVCWISKSQLSQVSRLYRTTTTTIRVNGRSYTLVTVFGADERTLRTLLGTKAMQCRLVHVAHVFFLPFDPNLS